MENQKEEPSDEKNGNLHVPPPKEKANSNVELEESKTNNPTHGQDSSKQRWWVDKSKRESAMIITTFMLAIFTAWMACETHKMVNQTGKSVEWADSSFQMTKRSVEIADSSVSLSKKIAATQERFARIQARAYFRFKDMRTFVLKVGEVIDINMEFLNSGNTPAYAVRDAAGWKTGTGLYKGEIDELKTRLKSRGEGVTIGAGQIILIQMGRTRVLTKTDSVYIATGVLKMLLYGEIVFLDAFGTKQWFHFCFQCSPDLKSFIPYGSFNDASHQ